MSFITPTRYIDERIKAQSGGFIRQNLAGCSFEEALSETMCIESLVCMNKGGVLSRGTPYDDVVCKESKVIKWIFPREQGGGGQKTCCCCAGMSANRYSPILVVSLSR